MLVILWAWKRHLVELTEQIKLQRTFGSECNILVGIILQPVFMLQELADKCHHFVAPLLHLLMSTLKIGVVQIVTERRNLVLV